MILKAIILHSIIVNILVILFIIFKLNTIIVFFQIIIIITTMWTWFLIENLPLKIFTFF